MKDKQAPTARDEVTKILEAARAGDPSASGSFWAVVYAELRELAQRELSCERAGHTLQPTALVHEVYLRLNGSAPVRWENRAHFFGAVAQAMRRILVDHARARGRKKRARKLETISLDQAVQPSCGAQIDLLSLDEAMDRLAVIDIRKAQVVELRYFAGLTVAEIANLLGVATGTVSGDWKIARMWLHRELNRGGTDDS